MRPAEHQFDRAAATLPQGGEPGVAIDLQLAVEAERVNDFDTAGFGI
jgi:hypothetical protein